MFDIVYKIYTHNIFPPIFSRSAAEFWSNWAPPKLYEIIRVKEAHSHEP